MSSPKTESAAPQPSPAPSGPDWLMLPEGSRLLPFLVWMIFLSLPQDLFPGSTYWNYAIRTVAVGGLLVWLRPWLPEMKWSVSWEAVAVGLGIAVLWLVCERWLPTSSQLKGWIESGLGQMPKAKPPEPWNPVAYFSGNAALGWGLVGMRVVGRSVVVPMVEEVFYRSFLYRVLVNVKFEEVSFSQYRPLAFFGTSAVFGIAHGDLWIPAVICGMAYQWLALRKNRLGDSMTAHGITNLVISVWTIYRGDWNFT